MDETVKWLLGFVVTLVFAAAGYSRHVSHMIKTGDDALHERINRVRDEYVRRVDLDAHLADVKNQIRDLRQDIKEGQKDTNDRLDTLLASVSKLPGRS